MVCRIITAVVAGLSAVAHAEPGRRLRDYVDPAIGTARKDQAIGADNSGQTYPAVGVPLAMTHWTPQTQATEDKCVSPYYHQDTKIQGFRGTHWWSGSCTHDYGSVTVAAAVGPLQVDPVARAVSFNHKDEVSGPAYYAVPLPDAGVRVELTGTARAGVLRFTFTRTGEAHVLVHTNGKTGQSAPEARAQVSESRAEYFGSSPVQRLYAGKGKPAGFSGHFFARLQFQPRKDKSLPLPTVTGAGVWSGTRTMKGQTETRGDLGPPGAFLQLRVQENDVAVLRVGTSFVSVDEARRNLDAEVGTASFDDVKARAEATWEDMLGRIQVRGGSASQRTIFYTALYHALLMPRLMSDVSGTYPAFGGGQPIARAQGWDYYDDFSLWDTFRAVHPLLVLIAPERVPSLMKSLVVKAEQGGFLPNFPGWNSYTSAMVGDHGASVLADAYAKGIRGFPAEAALDAMVKNATVTPSPDEYLDGKGRRALPHYLKLGYIPLEEEVKEAFHKREQVSRTLEYAYDDFAVATLAHGLGKQDLARSFFQRSENWRHVVDPAVGFARGRHADGRWATPFDPGAEQPYITEGTPWQYTFFVPHNLPGLIEVLGGAKAFVTKLDRFFGEKRYWHGNEPSHHIAYLYNHAGAPWRTQQEVRTILAREYGLGPAGIKGNDDTGQLSAWYVLSAIGLYPTCPGIPRYDIGSPIFDEIRIAAKGGRTFTLRAPGTSQEGVFIQKARLGGKSWTNAWIDHADVAAGNTLELRMGTKPQKRWGVSPAPRKPTGDILRGRP